MEYHMYDIYLAGCLIYRYYSDCLFPDGPPFFAALSTLFSVNERPALLPRFYFFPGSPSFCAGLADAR